VRSGGSKNKRRVTVVRRLRLFFGITGVLTVLAGFALPTDAGLLSTGRGAYCDPNVSRTFEPWGDRAYYMLTPGGSFEPGTPGWRLERGARVVSDNESFYLNSKSDTKSLYMPSGSTAITPTMCFKPGDWHMRFVAKGEGRVRVTIMVPSLLGLLSILDGGTVRPGETWTPSPKVSLLLTNVGGLLTTRAIALKFTASNGASQIDDVYLDPFKDT
jgi:hypothetical protein